MGLAKRCDRCEKLYESKDIDIRGAIVNGLGLISRDAHNINVVPRRYFDLCPECLLSFANWLKNKPMTFNEIRQAVGLEPIRDGNKVFTQLYSEKENNDDQT